MAGSLDGIRVVDMTAVLLGPVATQVFGDLGADVIKVESPKGDTTRSIGHARHPGMGSLFLHTNRNKRSIVLDLKQPEGREAMTRLLERADVLFYNIRPQAMERLGLGYAQVSAINPRIVYCGAFGYGQNGRYAKRPAYDDLIQGAVALPSLMQRLGGEPRYIPAALLDRMVALTAAYSVIAALYHRERSGKGQSIEVPMFETMAQMILAEHMSGRSFEPPIGEAGYARLLSPVRRPYRTKDGYICALTYTDRHWQRFFEAVGRPELNEDPRFRDLASRTRHIDELYGIAESIYATRPTAEWMDILDSLDIPVMALHTLESLIDDPHLKKVGFFELAEHPTEGPIWTMPRASTWSETPPEVRRQAPTLGQHSREILREMGYRDDEIDDLRTRGITIA